MVKFLVDLDVVYSKSQWLLIIPVLGAWHYIMSQYINHYLVSPWSPLKQYLFCSSLECSPEVVYETIVLKTAHTLTANKAGTALDKSSLLCSFVVTVLTGAL